ncbi:hypothetical protein EC973_009475 [Apophysomyces ossiformis]|uniref:Uncharacterized protein n=1 Tax=Apophysomyces ossiformis TaxID=679940 RepID=A0A8H7EP55_9FUNG|nr:hypothetical protein EC973_009475 [Apophysomyces ossiformis]
MSFQSLSNEELGQLVCQQLAINEDEAELPNEILMDLEDTTKYSKTKNIKKFESNLPSYGGGKWTKSGALNKILYSKVKKYKLDRLSVVLQKYKGGDKLRATGQAAIEAYKELYKCLHQEVNEPPTAEEFKRILERLRRLAVYAFTTGKHINNDAKNICNKGR